MLYQPCSIKFDPTNKEHRLAVRDFLKRHCWADSKIRFTEDPKYTSIAAQVQEKVLVWYLQQEVDE